LCVLFSFFPCLIECWKKSSSISVVLIHPASSMIHG
jgi:hypothetical protein